MNSDHCYRIRTHYKLSHKRLSDDEINKAGTDKEYFKHLCFYDTNIFSSVFGKKIIKSEKGYEVEPLFFNCNEPQRLSFSPEDNYFRQSVFCVKNTRYDICLDHDTKKCPNGRTDGSCVALKFVNKETKYRLTSLCLTPTEESNLTKSMNEIGYSVSQDEETGGKNVKFVDDSENFKLKKKENENEASTKENVEQSRAPKKLITESEKNNHGFSEKSSHSELIIV